MRWVRPCLLVCLTLGLFASTTWMTLERVITAEIYVSTWSPILALMIGHLFGERAQMQRKEDKP